MQRKRSRGNLLACDEHALHVNAFEQLQTIGREVRQIILSFMIDLHCYQVGLLASVEDTALSKRRKLKKSGECMLALW